jgi:NAD(P)-dependent dehydrogenase (short-subunit alcohol dehydrogenase family)
MRFSLRTNESSKEDAKEEQVRPTDAKGNAKTVLITGCSEGGIGSALAFSFHRHGCRVFATARNLSKVQHLKNAGIEVLELDVLDEVNCRKAAEWVSERTGGMLNMLVNNSGVGEWNIFGEEGERGERDANSGKDILCRFSTRMLRR